MAHLETIVLLACRQGVAQDVSSKLQPKPLLVHMPNTADLAKKPYLEGQGDLVSNRIRGG